MLSRAVLAVGMHGSLLIMAAFLPPGAALLELYPFGVPAENYTPYRTMAGLPGPAPPLLGLSRAMLMQCYGVTLTPGMNLRYAAWVNTDEARSQSHPDNPPHLGGLAHLTPAERTKVGCWRRGLWRRVAYLSAQIIDAKTVPPHVCCSDPAWLFRIYQVRLWTWTAGVFWL